MSAQTQILLDAESAIAEDKIKSMDQAALERLLYSLVPNDTSRPDMQSRADRCSAVIHSELFSRCLSGLEKQMGELVGIAAEQKRLAAKLDVQTDTLISLTRWLRGLTIALVVLAIPLFLEALHLVKPSKDSAQITPRIEQPQQPAQQNTNQ